MRNLFQQIEVRKPRRNKFNLSHEKKLSGQMGVLTPILLLETVPGDSFRVKSEILVRLPALLAPIMHRLDVTTHYFFVPNRLVWDEWEDFITGGPDGDLEPVHPYFDMNTTNKARFAEGQLADYFGIPPMVQDANPVLSVPRISALPFRAYTLIYNEYYRDQNVTDPVEISKASGDSQATFFNLFARRRCWEKDYFTSALPFAQRGPAVLMPLEGNGTINYSSEATFGAAPAGADLQLGVRDATQTIVSRLNQPDNGNAGELHNLDSVIFENSSITINDLRRSIRLQEWLERNARGGARYVEQIMSHFGVRSSDARLQRPEFLGGGRNPVTISEVLSTVEQFDITLEEYIPLGTMGGHGISFGRTNGFSRTFEEHGFIIGIMSVLPRTAYQDGINKMFSRFDRFDYYWPEFANIGEQEVRMQELYTKSTQAVNLSQTFGYQSRYAEYKYMPSTTHGVMRSSLSYWHMNRIFTSEPSNNETFMACDPTTRVFPVLDNNQTIYCQIYNKVDALRPMPYFGTPTI